MGKQHSFSTDRQSLLYEILKTIERVPDAWEYASSDQNNESESPSPDFSELEGTIWSVIDGNGVSTALTFAEMMVFTHLLAGWAEQEALAKQRVLRKHLRIARQRLKDPGYIEFVLRTPVIQHLLSKLPGVGRKTDFSYDPKRMLHPDEIVLIRRLLHSTTDACARFKIFPPKIVAADPFVLESDDVVDLLINTTWGLRFPRTHVERLSFVALLAFAYNLASLQQQLQAQWDAGIHRPIELPIAHDTSVVHLLRPAMAQGLLDGLRGRMKM